MAKKIDGMEDPPVQVFPTNGGDWALSYSMEGAVDVSFRVLLFYFCAFFIWVFFTL